jgi:hypothetical protein
MIPVFAIDPGSEVSTAVIYDGTVREIIRDELNEHIVARIKFPRSGDPDCFAIEDIESMGMAVGRDVFETVRWSGRMQQAIVDQQQSVAFVKRSDIKLHLCGRRDAKDKNIRLALIDLFGGSKKKAVGLKASPGPLYGIAGHAWSALAVAVTYVEMCRTIIAPEEAPA